MKTRREHLSVLPSEILKEFEIEALKRWSEKEVIEEMQELCDKDRAIKGLFVFSDTEKGHAYWWNIYEKYIK